MSKIEKTCFKDLDKLYKKDKSKIINWLNDIKTDKLGSIHNNGTVLNLLTDNYIQLETTSESGKYNIILKWISLNLDKFDGYDFNGIPPSVVNGNIIIDLSNISVQQDTGAATNISLNKTFKTEEDVKRWFLSPETHPITGLKMSPMSTIYADIYNKAYNIIKKKRSSSRTTNRWCYNNFPKNHRLFNGELDLLYHTFISEGETPKFDRYFATSIEIIHFDLCELLRRGIDNTEEKDNVLDTEIELIKNRFSLKEISGNLSNNYISIIAFFELLFEEMIKNLRSVSLKPIPFKNLKIRDITKCEGGFAKKAIIIIDFIIIFLENILE